MPLHDRIDAPDPITLVGTRVQVKPVAGLTVEVSPTRPLKPSSEVTAIVEVPACLVGTVIAVGLPVAVKSWTVNVTIAERDKPPPFPVTVTVYAPAAPVQDSVEVLEIPRVTLVGLTAQVRPIDGDTAAASDTVPVKPCSAGRAVTVIVEVPAVPALTVALVGLAATMKSWTVKVTV